MLYDVLTAGQPQTSAIVFAWIIFGLLIVGFFAAALGGYNGVPTAYSETETATLR